MKQIALIALPCLAISATSLAKPIISVSGNPIKRQDNYTINNDVPRWIDVGCRFTNTGKKPVDLKIWISPNSTIAEMSVHLKSGSTSNPYKTSRRFHLQLKKHWWCSISAPKDKPKAWQYCTYFSISDATIARYKPFKVWNKTIHSKDAHYYCYLKHPNGRISFFYFH